MRDRRWLMALASCGGTAIGVLAFYLSVYAVRGYHQPLGYDTARYLWRTGCVAAGGLAELRRCAPTAQALPSRVGYPMVSLLLSACLHTSRYTLAAVIPAVTVSAIALAGAALMGWAVEPAPGRFAVLALVVGASPMVVAMAAPEGYADTMLAVAIGMSALLAAALVAERGRGYVAAWALLAVVGLVHTPTALVFGVVLVLAAAIEAVGALRRRGTSKAFRLAAVVAGAAALWAAMVAVFVRARPDAYRAPTANLEAKLRSHWARLGFPVGIPAAAAGAVVLARGSPPAAEANPERRRLVLSMLLAWSGVVVLAVVAWFAGWKLPLHRFLLLSLPVPLLGGIALLWMGARAESIGRGWNGVVVVAGCTAVVAAGYALWFHNAPPVLRGPRLDAARTAVAYIGGLPPGQQVIVVSDASNTTVDVLAQTFRVVLPEARISQVRFAKHVPVLTSPSVPVELELQGYSRAFAADAATMPDRLVAPSVYVAVGPLPPQPIPEARGPRLGTGFAGLLGIEVAAVVLLGLVGVGWSALAFGASLRPLEQLAAAPALGLAWLVADGLILDLFGLRVRGPAAIGAAASAAVAGAIVALWRRGTRTGAPLHSALP